MDQVSAVAITGGQRRQVSVDLESKLVWPDIIYRAEIAGAVGTSNRRLPARQFSGSNREFVLEDRLLSYLRR